MSEKEFNSFHTTPALEEPTFQVGTVQYKLSYSTVDDCFTRVVYSLLRNFLNIRSQKPEFQQMSVEVFNLHKINNNKFKQLCLLHILLYIYYSKLQA